MSHHFIAADFSAAQRKALTKKGIRIIGAQACPDMTSSMPYANATRGYLIDDNGCGRVWSYQEVVEAAR